MYFTSFVMLGVAEKSVARSAVAANASIPKEPSIFSEMDFESTAVLLCAMAGLTTSCCPVAQCLVFPTTPKRFPENAPKHAQECDPGTNELFDRNPSGRILNRFSTDLSFCDDRLPRVHSILFRLHFR